MFKIFNKDPKPFNEEFLNRGDGHTIYFAEFGNPKGNAWLVFHGGPGSSSKPHYASIFNLKKSRVIVFDQRGCGKSTYKDRFKNNDTGYGLEDAKAILDHLGIEKLGIQSGSWGSTLALLFAQKYPKMVDRMVLASIFLARKKDIDWVDVGSGILYPDIYEKIVVDRKMNITDYYYKKLFSGKKSDMIDATKRYGSYEHQLGSLSPSLPMNYTPDDRHINSFKMFMHYVKNNFFIKDNEIINNIYKIRHIPLTIVHARLDLVCPLEGA